MDLRQRSQQQECCHGRHEGRRQRIQALEDRLGHVPVVREAPCQLTPAGETLLQRLQPMQLLAAEALAELMPAAEPAQRPIPLAVNDDSLETWFMAALASMHGAYGYLFDLRVDDREHTLVWLRRGEMIGAVTAQATPLQGCAIRPLGHLRYHATAAPAFRRTAFSARHGRRRDCLGADDGL